MIKKINTNTKQFKNYQKEEDIALLLTICIFILFISITFLKQYLFNQHFIFVLFNLKNKLIYNIFNGLRKMD